MSGKRIHLSVVTSTNIHSNDLLSQSDMVPYTVVSADYQTGGKGQRGRVWQSEFGKNLLMSILLKPNISLEDQYYISIAASLAIVDSLAKYNISAEVKWPNDIMVNGAKIAGLLIENHTRANRIDWSIVGIGLNVNQVDFEDFDWPATSMINEIDGSCEVNREEVLRDILNFIKEAFIPEEKKNIALIDRLNQHLFGRNNVWSVSSGGEDHEGIIRGVKNNGALMVKIEGELKGFFNGEIKLNRISNA